MFVGSALLIAGCMIVFVAAPLLTMERAGEGRLPIDVTPLADLKRRRLVVYENIQDLEFEYKAGKIASEDYLNLSREYRAEAARLMVNSQSAEMQSPEDALIEREVAARRFRRQVSPVEEYVCADCGFENPLPVKFCGECGAKISGKGRVTSDKPGNKRRT